MRLAHIETVEAEISRLLKRIEELKHDCGRDDYGGGVHFCSCCRTAAVHRASMDLTRALTRLRRER